MTWMARRLLQFRVMSTASVPFYAKYWDPSSIRARCLGLLRDAGVPFLVGGAYALRQYCAVRRDTKDLDIFAEEKHVPTILDVLGSAGYRTDIPFPHWLAKAYCGEEFIDVIFNSGNGLTPIDESWFANAPERVVLGVPVRVCAVEETIWSKAFVMERERFDGADIAHLLAASGKSVDWRRLLDRFGGHWRVLFAHLLLFEFVYPDEAREQLPRWVVDELAARTRAEAPEGEVPHLCRGTLLSREQYLGDLRCGYHDARLPPTGTMSPETVATWTDAIGKKK